MAVTQLVHEFVPEVGAALFEEFGSYGQLVTGRLHRSPNTSTVALIGQPDRGSDTMHLPELLAGYQQPALR